MNYQSRSKGSVAGFLLFIIFILLLVVGFHYLSPELKSDFRSIYNHVAPAAKWIIKWGMIFTAFVVLVGGVIAVFAISKLFGKGGFLRNGFNIPAWISGGKTVTVEIKPHAFDRNIRVKTIDGDIDLTGVKGAKIFGEVDVICKGDDPSDLTAEYSGDSIDVISKSGDRLLIKAFRLSIPQNVENVSAYTTSGKITIAKLAKAGSIEAKSVSGSILIKEIKDCAKMHTKTVSGPLDIEKVNANSLEFTTVSGETVLKGSKIDIASGKSVSGNIDCKDSKVKKVDLHSVSGKVLR